MSHKTMIDGVAYEISGGKTLIGGTSYEIDKGKTLVGGTAYEVGFDSKEKHVTASGEILDTWAVISACTYRHYYSLGNWKTLSLTNGATITMEIVAFNADYCSDIGRNAPITWVQKEVYWTGQHNSAATLPSYGFTSSLIRPRLLSGGDIYNSIPAEVMSVIKTARKYDHYYYDGKNTFVETRYQQLWIPSYREIFGGSSYEHVGPEYTSKFNSSANRKKYKGGRVNSWALRTVNTRNDGFWYVTSYGSGGEGVANITVGVVIGFCT